MRLGELLLQHRVLTAEQLRSGLDAQQAHGARLGTHLFQLGYIDVDLLSRALGQQRGFPAALRKHVAAIDPRIIEVIPAKTALAYQIIPVGLTDGTPPRVVIAAADPESVPVEELAFEVGSRVDVWIAPEIVVAECLEKYYGGPPVPAYSELDFSKRRSLRSIRANQRKRASTDPAPPSRPPSRRPPTPPPPAPDSEPPDSPPIPSIRTSRPPTRPPVRAPTPPPPPPFVPASPPPPPVARPPTPPPPPPFAPASPPPPPVRAVALQKPSLVPPEPDIPDLPPDDGWDMPEDPPLAPPPTTSQAPEPFLLAVIDQAEASRLITSARSRDEIGQALASWLRSVLGCGLVLVVKGETAVGWKGYFPDAAEALSEISIPLGTPSLLGTAYERKLPFSGAPPREGEEANRLFWKALGCQEPSEVLVCPVVVGKRAVNLLYAHPVSHAYLFTDTILHDAQILAAEASAAYVRLIRGRSNS